MRKSLREHSLGLFFYMKYCELILLDIMYNDILVFFFERHAHVAVLSFTDPFCEVRSLFLCHVPCSRKCRNFLECFGLISGYGNGIHRTASFSLTYGNQYSKSQEKKQPYVHLLHGIENIFGSSCPFHIFLFDIGRVFIFP